jgi:hypothetical protein
MMLYKALADAVVVLHLLWIGFLVLGAIWGAKSKRVKTLHIGGLAFAIFIQLFNWYCPLTYLEVWLRLRHDPALAYPGSFIAHYAEKAVYLEIPGYAVLMLTVALCAVNAWIYLRGRAGKVKPGT